MEKFEKVKQLISEIGRDVEKFYSANNYAAGTRVRKVMQELKVLASDIRKEISEIKQAKK